MPCVSSRNIAEVTILMFDTHGKRDADLNLKSVVGELKFRALLEEADVLLDWYNPVWSSWGLGGSWCMKLRGGRGRGLYMSVRIRMDGRGVARSLWVSAD